MVTAELAVALPALVLVVSILLSVVGTASDVSRSSEAARSAARAASVGTATSLVTAQAQQVAPEGAVIRVWTDGPWVRAEVIAPGRRWGPITLPETRATAAALLEPGLAP